MLWWSSSDTAETKAPDNDISDTISGVQPATAAGYGLPADRALEPLHLPPEPSPAPTSPPAPIRNPASPKVVAEPRSLSTQVERLDKQWLLHMLDEHMSKMQESFNELQKSVDDRFEAVESDAAQARSHISANVGTLKRLGLAYSNLETAIKQTKAQTISSVTRLSTQASPQASSNMMKEVQAAVQFVQESTQERADELSRVQLNLNGYVRDSVRKIKQDLHTIDKKILNLQISASLFSLKVGEMSDWERSHSLSTLRKKQKDMQIHSKLQIDNDSTDDPTERLRFEEMLCQVESTNSHTVSSRAEEPSSPTGTATNERLQSAELEIEALVDEAALVASPEKSLSIEANASATTELHTGDLEKSADRREVDQQQLRSMVEEISSNELKGLDAKLTLLSLSSNLFCIKTFNLSKPVRARCIDLLESQLKALKARAGHLGNLSHFTTSSDAALEALISETRRLESNPHASSGTVEGNSTHQDAILTSSQNASSDAAEYGSASKDGVLEEASRSEDVSTQPTGPKGKSPSPEEDTVPPEIDEQISMKYSTPTHAMMSLFDKS